MLTSLSGCDSMFQKYQFSYFHISPFTILHPLNFVVTFEFLFSCQTQVDFFVQCNYISVLGTHFGGWGWAAGR